MAVLPLVLVALAGLVLWRNHRVYRFHLSVLDSIVSPAAQRRIDEGQYDSWRVLYRLYDRASYTEAVVCFWRPLTAEEWYPDLLAEVDRR